MCVQSEVLHKLFIIAIVSSPIVMGQFFVEIPGLAGGCGCIASARFR